MNKNRSLKVLVADDSVVVQKALAKSLSGLENIEKMEFANNGVQLLNKIKTFQPDIVICDLRMPYLDGIDAFEKMQQERQKPPIPVIFFSANFEDEQMALRLNSYLDCAWVRVVSKPKGLFYETVSEDLRKLCLELNKLFPQHERVADKEQKIEMICIGASAGGPDALCELFFAMGKIDLPILLVQHNTPGYGQNFNSWLQNCLAMPLIVVEQPQLVQAGYVYLPPDNHHLWVSPNHLVQSRKHLGEERYCPSIDITFHSVASVYGKASLGILLSGMGEDGVRGLRDIFQTQGITVVQNKETSKVFGMPQAALRQNIVNLTLSPEEIGVWLKNLVN